MNRFALALAYPLTLGLAADASFGQTTTVNANVLALRSNGSASGNDWILNGSNSNTQVTGYGNGYVGTYITLASPGNVTLNVRASGSTNDGTLPHMNVVVNDSVTGWNVASGFTTYSTTLNNLPAGTHFIRVELDNDLPTSNRLLTVDTLQVVGATVSNSTTVSTLNSNALAAANTYIANYRKGQAAVHLPGVAPGTPVQVDLVNHQFMFGTAVSGTQASNGYMDEVNPSPTSTAGRYQNFLNTHFNAIVPENAGKWPSNEWTRDNNTLGYLEDILDYAESHGMRARMHNLLWGQSGTQPSWVHNMLNNPNGIDPVSGLTNRDALRAEITERINYYVANHADDYLQLDVVNESVHQNIYTNVYGGISGLAGIHNEVAQAVTNAGGVAKLYPNEFNLFQWSTDPDIPGPFPPYPPADEYANWYRQHVENIQNAGGQVDGIGVQYYADNSADNAQLYSPHSTNRMMKVLQNLSVEGLPIALTEFGISSQDVTPAIAAEFLENTMRMVFGTPQADTFMMWGFWQGAIFTPASALVDNSWNLTDAGKKWEDLLGIQDWNGNPNDAWDTLLSTNVTADGKINFNGFYGDYILTIDGQQYAMSLVKGQPAYIIPINPGDFDFDGDVDADDIDLLSDNYGAGTLYDLDGDNDADQLDMDELVGSILGTEYGDADLDGDVDGADFDSWRIRDSLGGGIGWSTGDFDGDGDVDGADFDLWRLRPAAIGGSSITAVPEPAALHLALLAAGLLLPKASKRPRN